MPYDDIPLPQSMDNFVENFEKFILSCKFRNFFKAKAEEKIRYVQFALE